MWALLLLTITQAAFLQAKSPKEQLREICNAKEMVPNESKFVAKGHFGRVYWEMLDGEKVAIKELKFRKDKEDGMLSLLNEISILKKCSDSAEMPGNLVRFHGAYHRKDKKFRYYGLIMDFVEGPDLEVDDKWSEDLFSERCTCRIVHSVLEALRYLHSLHISHRDIKPENIIISLKDGGVKLVDFGLATDNEHAVRFNGGSRAYASPEVLTNGYTHHPNDIWCLGAAVYEMITGDLVIRVLVDRSDEEIAWLIEIFQIGSYFQFGKLKDALSSISSENLRKYLTASLSELPENRLTAERLLEDPCLQQRATPEEMQSLAKRLISLKAAEEPPTFI